jgi:CRP/FNR family transcriptional regulator, nitrogen oxide reductase regulator
MTMQEIARPPTFLSGLTADQSKLILQSAERRRVPANNVIVTGGTPATSLFNLTEGTAKFFRVTKNGDEVLLWWLSSGDTFGIGALLAGPVRYIGTAETVDDCELLVWNQEIIRPLADTYSRLAENALKIALFYLAAYADRLVGLMTDTAEQRLARTLLQLSNRVGQVQPSGVDLAIRNEDLSGLANVSAFTASRQLKKWERQGVIKKNRGKIHIFSPENLLID